MNVCLSFQGKPAMEEEKRHNHPSLPSNYVTIAQLQERWLKRHQQNQQPQQQQQQESHGNQKYQNDDQRQQQGRQNRGKGADVVGSRGTAFGPSFGKQNRNMQPIYSPKICTDWGIKNVIHVKHCESEFEAGNGDENADLKIKGSESKWKPRVDERGTSEGAAEEAKSRVKNVKEEKCSEAVEAAVETEGKKEEEKFGDVKIKTEGEWDEKKEVNSKLEEVEGKIRGLSVNFGNRKQNDKVLRRVPCDFGHTQSQRSSYGGGFRNQRYEVKSLRAEKMVWVRKKMVWVRKDKPNSDHI